MIYETSSNQETQEIARRFALQLIQSPPAIDHALVLALEGELGAGKTTFTQGFAQALGIMQPLTSPTFVLMKEYRIPQHQWHKSLIHIDAYRLRDYHDLEHIGISDLLLHKDAIILLEWPERVSELIPDNHITVHIDHINENARKIEIVDNTAK